MPNIKTLNIAEAATLLEVSSILNVVNAGELRATRLKTADGEVVLIQGSSDSFLLVS